MNPPRIERSGDGSLQVSGELTFATVTALNGEASALLANSSGELVIDLAGVSRADSAGLALLIEWLRQAGRHGTTLHFSHMPAQMRSIAAASDLDTVLPISG